MTTFRPRTVAAALILLGSCLAAAAADPYPVSATRRAPAAAAVGPTVKASAAPAKASLLDFVAENYRDKVAAVVSSPTLAAKAGEDEFAADPKVYDWLLEHPDRVATAWQRLKVGCVDIADNGRGQFSWSDDNGSELVWQTVGRFDGGVVWYAAGKVKAGPLVPTVPVKAVAVLQCPRTPADATTGESRFKPVVNVYLVCDSKLASAAMRVAGPAAPKMAEEGAEQLLFFFSGIARYCQKKPEKAEALLAAKK